MEKIRSGLDIEKLYCESALYDIFQKVQKSQRLSFEEGVQLFSSGNLNLVGMLADIANRKKNGNSAYFIRNQHINHTNICRNKCKFCAFYRDKNTEGAYQMSLDEIFEEVERKKDSPISEIHIVGGLNPDLPFTFYIDMMKGIKEIRPDVHIQAFTCVEIAWFSEISGYSLEKTLEKLKDAGLGSIPGGGAEVFSDRLRSKYWSRKLSGDDWLKVAGTAHKMDIPTNATILYGHKETTEERVNHLIHLRTQQDTSGGFVAFIPLAFHSHNTGMKNIPRTTGRDDLMTIAVSRLMLDNFDHIKAFWIMLTPAIAALSLNYGADDIDGTVTEEKITHMAGASTPTALTVEELLTLIKQAGRNPVERDTLYSVINRFD